MHMDDNGVTHGSAVYGMAYEGPIGHLHGGFVAAAFDERFGVLPVEGYGTTELSPVVSGNQPPLRDPSPHRSGNRIGTIGRPLEGIEVSPDQVQIKTDTLAIDQHRSRINQLLPSAVVALVATEG